MNEKRNGYMLRGNLGTWNIGHLSLGDSGVEIYIPNTLHIALAPIIKKHFSTQVVTASIFGFFIVTSIVFQFESKITILWLLSIHRLIKETFCYIIQFVNFIAFLLQYVFLFLLSTRFKVQTLSTFINQDDFYYKNIISCSSFKFRI